MLQKKCIPPYLPFIFSFYCFLRPEIMAKKRATDWNNGSVKAEFNYKNYIFELEYQFQIICKFGIKKILLTAWILGVKPFLKSHDDFFQHRWFQDKLYIQRVPALRGFWDLKKIKLCKIHVSGTVGSLLLTRKSPTCTYISKKPR